MNKNLKIKELLRPKIDVNARTSMTPLALAKNYYIAILEDGSEVKMNQEEVNKYLNSLRTEYES